MTLPRFAISQTRIIYGGRIKVLLGITSVLNQLGITPTWLTYKMPGTVETIARKYGTHVEFDVKLFKRSRVRDPGEFMITHFNRMVSKWCRQHNYDWLLNSSNTLKGFSGFDNVISYVHFPREFRAHSPLTDIHDPNSLPKRFSIDTLNKHLKRLNYRMGQVRSSHRVIANSEFTSSRLLAYYANQEFDRAVKVIYPFATSPETPGDAADRREPAVASLGRFCSEKRQMEQARLGKQLEQSGLQIWIMGIANEDSAYVKKLRQIASEIQAVELLPNLNYEDVQSRLRRCRYFLHTNINEPFGITTVEAILNGAIPLVHNSGGQREVVTSDLLRFDELSEIPEKLTRLEQSEGLRRDLSNQLKENAQSRFTQSVFHADFHDYLMNILSI